MILNRHMEATESTRRSAVPTFREDRLRDARLGHALTQRELAEAVGVSHAKTISDWERGINSPSPRFIRALAEALAVSIPWLRGLN